MAAIRPVHEMALKRFKELQQGYKEKGVTKSYQIVPLAERTATAHALLEVTRILMNVVGTRERAVLERLSKARSADEIKAVLRNVRDPGTLENLFHEMQTLAGLEQKRQAGRKRKKRRNSRNRPSRST